MTTTRGRHAEGAIGIRITLPDMLLIRKYVIPCYTSVCYVDEVFRISAIVLILLSPNWREKTDVVMKSIGLIMNYIRM